MLTFKDIKKLNLPSDVEEWIGKEFDLHAVNDDSFIDERIVTLKDLKDYMVDTIYSNEELFIDDLVGRKDVVETLDYQIIWLNKYRRAIYYLDKHITK